MIESEVVDVKKQNIDYLEKAKLSQDIDEDLQQYKSYQNDCLMEHEISHIEFKHC